MSWKFTKFIDIPRSASVLLGRLDLISNLSKLFYDSMKTLHPKRLSMPGSFAKLPRKNTATTALGLLVTLSGNTECQSSILAHLCLPKPSRECFSIFFEFSIF